MEPARQGFRKNDEPEFIRDLYVSLKPTGSSESSQSDGIVNVTRYEVRTPWFPGPVKSSWYLELWDGRRFEIDGFVNVEEANIEWLIPATLEKQ